SFCWACLTAGAAQAVRIIAIAAITAIFMLSPFLLVPYQISWQETMATLTNHPIPQSNGRDQSQQLVRGSNPFVLAFSSGGRPLGCRS
ncbi:hypothetical protein, partial [Xanthomonas vasicola]|uniref:hypothetical protein n=1 Tax=Xanthomonas vasicola TaxID=56459 RepID=UPI001C82C3C0